MERAVLRSAAGLVTVSPIWADMLRGKYGTAGGMHPKRVRRRGFPALPAPNRAMWSRSSIPAGSTRCRDPAPLFQAIGLLTAAEQQHVAVHFYGPGDSEGQSVTDAAAAAGVADRVFSIPGCHTGNRCPCNNRQMYCCCCNGTTSRMPAISRQSLRVSRSEAADPADRLRARESGANDPRARRRNSSRTIRRSSRSSSVAGLRSARRAFPAIPAAARDGMSRADPVS